MLVLKPSSKRPRWDEWRWYGRRGTRPLRDCVRCEAGCDDPGRDAAPRCRCASTPQTRQSRWTPSSRAEGRTLARAYPPTPRPTRRSSGGREWTVHVWSGRRARSRGVVADADRRVTEAWTGPQVAWRMARGRPGAFEGKLLTSWPVWLGLSAVFLLGLVDLRRSLTVPTLDLLALLSFGVSLVFFNRGEVFQSPHWPFPTRVLDRAHELDRLRARRPSRSAPVTVARVGARRGDALPRRLPRGVERRPGRTVIDVGYAGVIGADRILDGRAPYGGDARHRRAHRVRAPRCRRRDPRADPVGRTVRVREPAGTRTGLRPTSRTSRPCSRSAGAAAGTSCPRLMRPRSRSTSSRSSGSRSLAGGWAGPGSPLPSPSAGLPTRSPRTR